ncbi:MAG: hypothetical protein OXC03_03155 [Flavobacteriaceae bacterium]|nr:hypothetical protein [Flavobacteriaceae bacterium]
MKRNKELNAKRFINQLNKELHLKVNSKTLNIYKLAFTHGVAGVKDCDDNPLNFERLEFLGDAIINLIIAQEIYFRFGSIPTSTASELNNQINCRKHLNHIGEKMNLTDFLQTGNNHMCLGENIHGNLVESLIGAVFVDRGYHYTHDYYINEVLGKYASVDFVINL